MAALPELFQPCESETEDGLFDYFLDDPTAESFAVPPSQEELLFENLEDRFNELAELYDQIIDTEEGALLLESELLEYSEDQPRVPAGQPGGGQFSSSGGGVALGSFDASKAGSDNRRAAEKLVEYPTEVGKLAEKSKLYFGNPNKVEQGGKRIGSAHLGSMVWCGDMSQGGRVEFKNEHGFAVRLDNPHGGFGSDKEPLVWYATSHDAAGTTTADIERGKREAAERANDPEVKRILANAEKKRAAIADAARQVRANGRGDMLGIYRGALAYYNENKDKVAGHFRSVGEFQKEVNDEVLRQRGGESPDEKRAAAIAKMQAANANRKSSFWKGHFEPGEQPNSFHLNKVADILKGAQKPLGMREIHVAGKFEKTWVATRNAINADIKANGDRSMFEKLANGKIQLRLQPGQVLSMHPPTAPVSASGAETPPHSNTLPGMKSMAQGRKESIELKQLPAESPEKRALRTQSVSSVEPLSGAGNVNATYKVVLEDGTKGVFKPESGMEGVKASAETYELHRAGIRGLGPEREAAASDIADVLGLEHLVPKTTVREVEIDGTHERGSFQKFVDDADEASHVSAHRRFDGLEDQARAGAFDYLIGNSDRHWGNWMIDDSEHLHLIDNGLAFPDSNEQHMKNAFLLTHLVKVRKASVPTEVKNWGKNWPRIQKVMESYGFDESHIGATRERLNALVSNAGKKFSTLKRNGPTTWHFRFQHGETNYEFDRLLYT